MKTISSQIAKAIRTIAASLIILLTLAEVSKGENSGKETIQTNTTELSTQIESWIGSDTFWSNETDNQEQELASEIKTWLNNATDWNNNDEPVESELAIQMKLWISNSNFWCAENNTTVQDLTAQIKLWLTQNAYWNQTEDAINTGSELANN